MSGDRRPGASLLARSGFSVELVIAATVGIALWSGVITSVGSAAWGDERVIDPRIRESSGLAVSQRSGGRFWTHNDSGDSGRLFALDGPKNGSDSARQVTAVQLAGAEAVDWEDMASGVIDGRATLVVADLGDNGRRRDRVTLYVIDEPFRGGASPDGALTIQARHRIEFRYPDGPRDCEAVAIDAERRRVICISKELLPLAGLYSVPLPPVDRDSDAATVVIAERLGTLPLPMVTGMDIRGDGLQMAVTGYFDLFLFERAAGEPWEVALRRIPKHIPLPKLKQIEAVCFDRQGELWISSEGHPMPMLRVSTASRGKLDSERKPLSEQTPLREGTR